MDRVLDSAPLSPANKRRDVFAIGAHPDDIELGCGAPSARLAQKRIYIATVVMTTGNSDTDEIINRHEESRNASKILGYHQTIHPSFAGARTHLQFNDMVSTLEGITKNQIPSNVEIMRVYTIHDADRRQDRLVIYQVSVVACHTIPQILGYETPGIWLLLMPQVSESIREEYFAVRLIALKKYKSQERRDYVHHGRLRAAAQFRGQQVSNDLGEGFVIHKAVL